MNVSDSSNQNQNQTPTANQKPQAPRQPPNPPPKIELPGRIPPSLRAELADMLEVATTPRILKSYKELTESLLLRMWLSILKYLITAIKRDLDDKPPKIMYR